MVTDSRSIAASRLTDAITSGDDDAIEDAEAALQEAWEAYDAEEERKG